MKNYTDIKNTNKENSQKNHTLEKQFQQLKTNCDIHTHNNDEEKEQKMGNKDTKPKDERLSRTGSTASS